MHELVIASTNPQKVLQLREILKELLPKATILSLFDFPHYVPKEEQTASEKALSCAKAINKNCVAEEWKLVLPALEATISPLFATKEPLSIKIKKLLAAVDGKSEFERSAYLESSVCFATPDGKTKLASARMEGVISDAERGKGSSDFDSIFIKHDYMKTLAELAPSVRQRISHRRKALEKLLIYIETYAR